MALHNFTISHDEVKIIINGHEYNKKGIYLAVIKYFYDTKENVDLFHIGFMKEDSHDMLGYHIKQTNSANTASKVIKQLAKLAGNIEIKEIYIKQTV